MRALLKPGAVLLVTGALAVFALVAAGVAVGEAGEQGPEPSRVELRLEAAGKTPPSLPEASMALKVKSGGTCVDAVCTVLTGAKFTLAVEIEVAPATGYIGVQTWIDFGNVLTYNPAVAADEIVWLDCEADVAFQTLELSTAVSHGCLSGLLPPLLVSTDTGNFVELSFTCSPDPSSTKLHLILLGKSPADNGGTSFAVPVDPLSDPDVPSPPVVPSVRGLTVRCGEPTATPTGTLSATPASSATPLPTGGATATPPGTPVGTPAATPTGGPTATPTSTTTGTPAATPTGGPTATPTSTTTGTPAATPTGGTTATPTATVGSMPTPTPAVALVGDANCDGNIDPIDAAFILQWSARLLATLPCPANADASGNGGVDPLDAALILQFSAGLIGTLPPVPA